MSHLIVISNPTDLENEVELIHSLFENGLECFHLRKPEKTKDELEAFLRLIRPKYYKRIVIHSHYSLIEKYNIKGIHFPERLVNEVSSLELIKPLQKRGFTVSCSIHAIETIDKCKAYNYIFLSPVFDSISKEGYKASIDFSKLKQAIQSKTTKVIALGGISSSSLSNFIVDSGFEGIAILGSIWKKDFQEATEEFKKIKSIASSIYNV